VPSAIDTTDTRKPVVIIGFMGTGKTTVGRLVAARLQRKFVDLDDLIVQAAGRPIADIFREEGEGGFRRREKAALEQALSDASSVIATGGGAACREDNLALLLARASVVALSATPEEVLRRTGRASGRPLLDGAGDPLATARHLMSQREEFYGRAHVQVDTVGKRPEDVAAEVLKSLAGLTAREQQEEAR
jgi:shikimate kinase